MGMTRDDLTMDDEKRGPLNGDDLRMTFGCAQNPRNKTLRMMCRYVFVF